MERNQIFEKIVEICKDVFENDELKITDTTSSTDIEEWDSLTYLSLINDIQDMFDITFTLDEIINFKNVGELMDVLIKYIGKNKQLYIVHLSL